MPRSRWFTTCETVVLQANPFFRINIPTKLGHTEAVSEALHRSGVPCMLEPVSAIVNAEPRRVLSRWVGVIRCQGINKRMKIIWSCPVPSCPVLSCPLGSCVLQTSAAERRHVWLEEHSRWCYHVLCTRHQTTWECMEVGAQQSQVSLLCWLNTVAVSFFSAH